MTNQCTVTVSMPADVFQMIAGRSPILSKRRVTKHVSTLLVQMMFQQNLIIAVGLVMNSFPLRWLKVLSRSIHKAFC
jgi:hypothetical protein